MLVDDAGSEVFAVELLVTSAGVVLLLLGAVGMVVSCAMPVAIKAMVKMVLTFIFII